MKKIRLRKKLEKLALETSKKKEEERKNKEKEIKNEKRAQIVYELSQKAKEAENKGEILKAYNLCLEIKKVDPNKELEIHEKLTKLNELAIKYSGA